MKSKKKILAIVGIRSGSTGLKNKNIKVLGHKPLVGWIIEAAKKSKHINRIVVSTDSYKYAKVVKKFNVEVPFLRPKKISKSYSDELDYIKHAINFLKKNENYTPDIIVRLLATVPFQKTKDIDKLIELVLKKKYDSSVIIAKAKQHPNKSLRIIKKGKFLVSYKTNKGIDVGRKLNRQSHFKKEDIYFRANVIVCNLNVIKKYNSLTSKKPGFLIIPNDNYVDIDSFDDFNYIKNLLKKKKIKKKSDYIR